jgi:hypothetical protein
MTEKLIVQNFAGISNLEIELNKINILIGPQASGKSICAKLLFYFKGFVWDLLYSLENEQTKRQLDVNYSEKFEEYFPSDSWGNSNFLIRYELAGSFIQVVSSQSAKQSISLSYSDSYKKELTALKKLQKKLQNKIHSNEQEDYVSFETPYEITEAMLNHIATSISKEIAFSQLFIPAGRSFFANLQSSIFSFLSNNNSLDPFLRNFGSTYENLKRFHRYRGSSPKRKNIREEIDKLVEEILCGKYIEVRGRDFLENTDGRRIDVSNSSSGQQETLPLAIMLSALVDLTTLGSGQTIYIEEPEAHLFPNAQRKVIELIAMVFNTRRDTSQFFITTHSPYVLTALNNLLQAGILYSAKLENNNYQKLKSIVSEQKALLTKDVSAYSLFSGKCESIICQETGLIDANIIDSVSNDLAVEFDRLLELT